MEKFTWEVFRSKRIAVRCRTEAEAREFLEFCRRAGFTWGDFADIIPDKYTHHGAHGEYTCYIARCDLPWMQYRSLSWALEHEYTVRFADEVIRELRGTEINNRSCRPKAENGGVEVSLPRKITSRAACWRDAERDKPISDGRYIVSFVTIEDRAFSPNVTLARFDVTNGWEYIDDAVITHWLDGVPPAPEVVVR